MTPRLLSYAALTLICIGSAQASAEIFRPTSVAMTAANPVVENSSVSPASSSTAATTVAEPRLTAEQLDQLLGPIALYPDALIALILPSATVSSDVVLAARYLSDNPSSNPEVLEGQPWDDSVKGLAHYPEVVKWMDQNLGWTKQLGEAFQVQPAEVMKSVQRLRAAARAAGTLVDTPQQQIVAEAETIYIVPAERDVIYVPSYDPEIVYLPRRNYYTGSFFSFSIGYPVGHWLGYHMDWHHCRLWTIDRHSRHHYWHAQSDWRRPAFVGGLSWSRDAIRRPWTPRVVYSRPTHRQFPRYTTEVIRPSVRDHRSTPSHRSPENVARRSDRRPDSYTAAPQTHRRDGASWANNSRNSSNPHNRFEPKVVAPQVQAPIVSVPAQPPVSSREGGRNWRSDDQGGRRQHHGPSPVSPNLVSRGSNRISPSVNAAPAPAQPAAPAVERTQSVGRGHRPHQPTPVAAAPRTEPSSSSTEPRESRRESRSSPGNSGHGGHRSHSSGSGRH